MTQANNKNALKPTILCMFSGGLDSYGCAWELLTNDIYKDFDICFHHMHLINREGRTKVEKEATYKFVEYCQENLDRPFKFTENLFGFGYLTQGSFPMDSFLYAFVAAMSCNNNPAIVHVAVGRTKTDIENGIARARHIIRSQEIFNTALDDGRRFAVNYIFPASHLSKREIYDRLPSELQNSFWSCRRPVDDCRPCGRCETCKTLKEIGIKHPYSNHE